MRTGQKPPCTSQLQAGNGFKLHQMVYMHFTACECDECVCYELLCMNLKSALRKVF